MKHYLYRVYFLTQRQKHKALLSIPMDLESEVIGQAISKWINERKLNSIACKNSENVLMIQRKRINAIQVRSYIEGETPGRKIKFQSDEDKDLLIQCVNDVENSNKNKGE
ncbi:TPA_asm: hypothetical protein GIO55_14310 [Listeria monocytogenes]|nr:hypothetical protein [Listeria monocytogenes]